VKKESTSQEKVNWGVGRIEKSSLVLSYIVTTSISTGAFRETAGYENFILNSKQWQKSHNLVLTVDNSDKVNQHPMN